MLVFELLRCGWISPNFAHFCTLGAQGCISYERYESILVYTAFDRNDSTAAAILCKIIEDMVLALRSLHRKGG